MTYDQGRETHAGKIPTERTGLRIYFPHPYSHWQRRSNDNTNGMLCQ